MAAAVVLDDFADVLGDGAKILDEVFGRAGAEVGVLLDGAVEIGDIGLVMLVVVELHGRLVDGGFEGSIVVGKRWNFVGHKRFLLLGMRCGPERSRIRKRDKADDSATRTASQRTGVNPTHEQ